jgi:thymidylate kinase
MTAGFPEPDLVLYLDVPVEVALARKQRITGYESGFAASRDAAAFAAFQAKVRPVLARFREGRGWISIDGAQSPDAVVASAWIEIQKLIRRREKTT